MNLLFLTIEFQRAESGDDLVSLPGPRRRSLRDRFTGRSVVAAAVAVCAFGAAVAALSIGGLAPGLTGGLSGWLPVSANGSERESGTAQLTVTSAPVNAVVLLDGRERGHTPISLAVARGRHTLELTHPTAIDEQQQLDI